jgi:hypothetical protein
MSLKSIDFQRGVGFQNFRERMILQTLVVPNLRSLNQGDKKQIFPVSRADLIFLAYVEYPLNVNVRDYWCFFLHLASHHYQLNKVLDIFPGTCAFCFIIVLVVEAAKIISNTLDLSIEDIAFRIIISWNV